MGRPLPTGLGLALDEERIEPALLASLESRLRSAARIRRVKGTILQRRTLRYELEHEGPGPRARTFLIGKVYESVAAGTRGFDALRWLNEHVSPGSGCLAVPRAVAYLPDFSLLLMEEAGGRSLHRMLKEESARPEHLRLFARALLELHGLPHAFGAPFTLDDHLAVRCAGLTGALQAAFPELARPIERILASARRAESGELAPACTVAHGDYHPGQAHLDGERVWLVDIDPLHQGNPGYDLAMALFSLKRLEATPEDARRIAPLRAAFCATYFERVEPRRAERLPLDVALIYLKRACKRFRWQDEDGWQDAVRRQIGLAQRCVDWLEEARPCRTAAEAIELCQRVPGPGT